jgi:hypothetical protein
MPTEASPEHHSAPKEIVNRFLASGGRIVTSMPSNRRRLVRSGAVTLTPPARPTSALRKGRAAVGHRRAPDGWHHPVDLARSRRAVRRGTATIAGVTQPVFEGTFGARTSLIFGDAVGS